MLMTILRARGHGNLIRISAAATSPRGGPGVGLYDDAIRRLFIIASVVAAIAAITGIVAYGRMHVSVLAPRTAAPEPVGDRRTAPLVQGVSLTGHPVRLRSFEGSRL